MIEIERKFLVKNENFKTESFKRVFIKQGFLNSDKNRVVRVRILDNKGFLTIKGITEKEGTTRFEWEKEIKLNEAEALFKLCEPGIVEKYRYLIKNGNLTFEVDEFLGDNKGLLVAEIELIDKNQKFNKPQWLGKEVTNIAKYYNANLIHHPFKNWKNN